MAMDQRRATISLEVSGVEGVKPDTAVEKTDQGKVVVIGNGKMIPCAVRD